MDFIILLTSLALVLQAETPYKASEEFKIELDYQFKQKPLGGSSSINLTETEKERELRVSGSNPLPYLVIRLSFLQLSDKEGRVRCTDSNSKTKLSKKTEVNREYRLDLGFTDDMKDRVTSHEYTIALLSEDKVVTSRIVLLVERDGTFFVNGVKRGKF